MARVNINQPPSDLDWENLGTIDKEKKTSILYLYLYENMNMNEVAEEVYGRNGISENNNVSNVMRCYGFSGRNSGYFGKKLNYELNYNDFREFVNKYPRGCRGEWPNHSTIDEFMRKKQTSKENSHLSECDDNQKDDRNPSVARMNNKNKQQINSATNRKTSTDSDEMVGKIIALILVLIIGIAIIKSILENIISNIPVLSYIFYEIGLWGIGEIVCIYGSIFLFIKCLVTKKLRKSLKIIIPMFTAGFLFAAISDGNFTGVLKAAIVAVVGYYFCAWLDKKNNKDD